MNSFTIIKHNDVTFDQYKMWFEKYRKNGDWQEIKIQNEIVKKFLNALFLDLDIENCEKKGPDTIKHDYLQYCGTYIDNKTMKEKACTPDLVIVKEWYYSIEKVTLDDIAEFHYRFEIIHPFQDGNGRIGRFLMLKQMIENNLPLMIVSWDTEDLYRNALNLCCNNDYSPLSTYLKTLTDFREDYKDFWKRP